MIRSLGGKPLKDWEDWAKRVLKPPLSKGVASHPEVYRFLKIFLELIERVKEQNGKIASKNSNIEIVFEEFLTKNIDKKGCL
jgi:hypothetical protein